MAVCVLLSVALARAVDDPADAIISEIISGAKTNSARAAKLLEVARSINNQPKVYVSILEKAVEFGVKPPVTLAGFKTAGDAISLLEVKFPDRKNDWTLKRIDVRRAKYRSLRKRSEKALAGKDLLTSLLAVGEIQEKRGNWTGAIAAYREAGVIDAYVKSGSLAEIRRKLTTATNLSMVAKKAAKYAAELTKDPSKSSTRDMLVKLFVLELNDPAGAVEYLNEDLDETWRTYVPLAAKALDKLPKAVCLELGRWYHQSLSRKALPTGKLIALRRAKVYYKRFVSLNKNVDIQAVLAKTALASVEADLAKFGTVADRTMMLDLGKGVTMKLRRIPAGKFLMGTPVTPKMNTKYRSDIPQRAVTISKPFHIGVCEVTQAQWTAVMGSAPWRGQRLVEIGDDYGASYIGWNDADKFCRKLSVKTGRKVVLPTEAQWEYACRAGSKTTYCFGNDERKLCYYAWYPGGRPRMEVYVHRVGMKKPNAWGLYDMHGNAREWCRDWFDEKFYRRAKNVDPENTAKTEYRSGRGGAWNSTAERCSSAVRLGLRQINANFYNAGFRVVVEAD